MKCPLCDRKVYTGPTSSLTYGVKCVFCGITVEEIVPDENPEGKTLEELDLETLNLAIDRAIDRFKKIT